MAKACPILSSAREKGFTECAGESCAWYIDGKCAIVIIAEKTREKEK